MKMAIYYEGLIVGKRRVDFFVEENSMVEPKAISRLEDNHLNQTMNYSQVYNLPVGLLLNFGSKSLQFKCVYNLNHPENKGFKKPEINKKDYFGSNAVEL